MIKREGDKYVLYTSDGSRVLGRHDSHEKALAQERAIQISKHKNAAVSNGYVALKPKIEYAKKLYAFLSGIGMTDIIPADEMHMTIMYDKSNSPKQYSADNKYYRASIVHASKLGEPGSEWEAVVLNINSPEIAKRFEDLKAQGFTHSYPELKQHISVKYKPDDKDLELLKINLPKLKAIMPDVILGDEYTEALTDEGDSDMLKDFFMKDIMHAGKFAKGNKRIADLDVNEIKMGIEIELEHTNSKALARKIALDHLTEIPDYYTRLKKMEEDAKRELGLK